MLCYCHLEVKQPNCGRENPRQKDRNRLRRGQTRSMRGIKTSTKLRVIPSRTRQHQKNLLRSHDQLTNKLATALVADDRSKQASERSDEAPEPLQVLLAGERRGTALLSDGTCAFGMRIRQNVKAITGSVSGMEALVSLCTAVLLRLSSALVV